MRKKKNTLNHFCLTFVFTQNWKWKHNISVLILLAHFFKKHTFPSSCRKRMLLPSRLRTQRERDVIGPRLTVESAPGWQSDTEMSSSRMAASWKMYISCLPCRRPTFTVWRRGAFVFCKFDAGCSWYSTPLIGQLMVRESSCRTGLFLPMHSLFLGYKFVCIPTVMACQMSAPNVVPNVL